MPKDDNVGLSLQDAWESSLAEDETPIPSSGSEGTEPLEAPKTPEGEQSTVETSGKKGLFSKPTDEGQVEQSQGELHTVTVRGETLQVTLDELINGYQRHEDYTRDKQAVKRQEEENSNAITLYAALQANPVETVRRLWEKVSQGQPVEASIQGGTTSSGAQDIEAIVKAQVEAALANDPRIKEWENQNIKDQVNAVFHQIEKDWNLPEPLTDEDKMIVMEEAEKRGTYDLEAVFAILMHKQQGMRSLVTNAESNSTSTGYGGEQAVGLRHVSAAPERFASVRDAINAALVEEGMSESDLNTAIAQL